MALPAEGTAPVSGTVPSADILNMSANERRERVFVGEAGLRLLPHLLKRKHLTRVEDFCPWVFGATWGLGIAAWGFGCVFGMLRDDTSSVATGIKAVLCTQSVIAQVCIVLVASGMLTTNLMRSPKVCFPLPPSADVALVNSWRQQHTGSHASRSPKVGSNPRVEALQSSYCMRCFLWRPDRLKVHHCSICQRCTPHFDHHCRLLGVCIGGTYWPPRGNRLAFRLLMLVQTSWFGTVAAAFGRWFWVIQDMSIANDRDACSLAVATLVTLGALVWAELEFGL
jgi:hypothetical protein